jgi:hypothetical protein
MNRALDMIWEKMKRTDGTILKRRWDGIEILKDIHGKFFYVKCKAGDFHKIKEDGK